MRLLIFDTETTGLPLSREPASKGPNNWPHLVSISWTVLDTNTNTELTHKSYIIYPDSWEIPDESTRIHGITTEEATLYGTKLMDVMGEFVNEQCDAWVAHNLEFDMGVIVNAVLWDLRIQFPKTPQRKYCSMLLSKSFCKLPGKFKGSYKPPKLKELYFYTFGKYPEETSLHNSSYDVKILTEIVKSCLPLRQAMGLVARHLTNTDGRTLRICLKHAEGDYKSDSDLGE